MVCGMSSPSSLQVRDTVGGLSAAADVDLAAVVAHLALPVSALVGLNVAVSASSFTWRGRTVTAGDTSVEGLCEAAALLSSLTAEPVDVFLDLRGSPADWVKPAASGSAMICFGADLLFGRHVFVELDGLARDRLDLFAADPAPVLELVLPARPPAVLEVPYLGRVLLSLLGDRVTLHAA